MASLRPTFVSLVLLGAGALAWGAMARSLAVEDSLQVPSNPLGIKRSPYGEVFAMAMQGPIDLYWHGGSDECDDPGCTNPEHHHHHEHEGLDCHCPDCVEAAVKPASGDSPLHARFLAFLEELNGAARIRTNPKAATQSHKFYLRRQIENKLRFAHELDPSHYGNYAAYHFFLTEPQLGTRPELTPEAARLADETIRYSLGQQDDPRPALTAAAAAENELQLMFGAPGRFTPDQMRQCLSVMNYSLERHRQIAGECVANGNWNLIPPLRQQEIAERFRFLLQLRDAAAATLVRLERQSGSRQVFTSP